MMSMVVEALSVPAETADQAQIVAADSDQTGFPALEEPEGAFAAPTIVPAAWLREEANDYPHVVARLNEHWRVIESRCQIQWILQRSRRRASDGSPRWEGSAYCRTREGLLSCITERCGQVHEARLRAIEQLPVRP